MDRQLYLFLFYQRTEKHLSNIISGKTVLVLGAGPSAKSLHPPPRDTVVMASNYSPLTLPGHPIDIFLYGKYCLKINPNFEEDVLDKITCKTILSNLTKHVFSKKHFFEDTVINHSLVKDVIGDTSHIQTQAYDNGEYIIPSSGLFLTLLAARHRAKEIYLSGFEFDFDNYQYWDGRPAKFLHKTMDTQIWKILKNSNLKIYSYSPSSGSTKFFSFKELEE